MGPQKEQKKTLYRAMLMMVMIALERLHSSLPKKNE
jgi:hypothetical protein